MNNEGNNLPQIIGYEISGTNRESVLREMARYLESKGLVKPTYAQSVVDRENTYPTGIPSEPIAVAIPHSERGDVLKTAVLIGRKKGSGIIFRRIDDPDIEVNAEVIFMLAVDSNQGQLDTISKIMELIQDSKLIETITKADTTEIIETLVSHAFLNE